MEKNSPKALRLQDYLSIFRIPAAIVLVFLSIYGFRTIFAWLFLVAAFTDALDGFIARKKNDTTKHGSRLDSLGDVSLFLGAVIGIIIFDTPFFREHLIWLLIGLGAYFLQLGLAFWRYGKPSSFHTYAAKFSAVVQGIFLGCTAFFGPWEWLFYITIIIGVLETLEEIILIFHFKNPVTDIKGLYWVLKNGRNSSN